MNTTRLTLLSGLLLPLIACGEAKEPARVNLEVSAAPLSPATITSDLGYEVEVIEARQCLEQTVFTIAGEVHQSSLMERLFSMVEGTAYAHPGHHQGGEPTGELMGRHVVAFTSQAPQALGEATLLAGEYTAANFTLCRASTADGLAQDDALLGHTAIVRGVARKQGAEFPFELVVDSPEDRQIVGVPFALSVSEQTTGERLSLRFTLHDDLEGDTFFDGVDFAALEQADPIRMVEGSSDAATLEAYETLRRTFQTHDHFRIDVQED